MKRFQSGLVPQLASLALADVAHARRQALGIPQHAGRYTLQLLARRREVSPTLAIHHQLGAEKLLKRLDMERHGRLAHSQVGRGSRKSSVLGDRHEHLQPEQAETGEQVTAFDRFVQ